MHTVFSHIIQKRFSQVNEDVATDALAYILDSSEPARRGMMKLLRGLVPNLPDLRFRTQQAEGNMRPDMWGYDAEVPRVFVENKFWAGLTDNQPVSYLNALSRFEQPTVLLVVAPAAREQALWRTLLRRLHESGIKVTRMDAAAGIVHAAATDRGPILALTAWNKLLSTLEREAGDDEAATSDLRQLRALCEVADSEAFAPVSSMQLSDQQTPAFLRQLGTVVQASTSLAVAEGTISIAGLNPQSSWERIGRYAKTTAPVGVGFWFGTHLRLWRTHGTTPLWLLLQNDKFGRASEARPLLESWIAKNGGLAVIDDEAVAVALFLPAGEEQDRVVRSLADQLKTIAEVLAPLQ